MHLMTTASRFMSATILILLSLSSLKAETITLSGTVRNQSAASVAGAEIKLLSDSSIGATTDSAGKFVLTGQITSLKSMILSKLAPSIALHGSNIRIVIREPSAVSVMMYTIAGKAVYDFTTDVLNAGMHIIALPMKRFGAGYYLVAVSHGGKRGVFGLLSASGHGNKVIGRSGPDALATVLERAAFLAEVAIDTLLISARDYHPAVYPVSSYNRSDIEIILQRVSRLENITRSCDGLMPGNISGGSSGWGSRYWDCCKPSCSWPENTSHIAANCAIDGAEEIECFYKDSAGASSWLVDTKSGCQGGVAFMCYRHVPFAVCEELAYGFAAVPAGNDACGKCFQLDFNGGFKHGEPKRAHAMMKGKKMIVMASNIGHDVAGGQFDLMIPGGGLGAFRDGCAKQWKVDVNDESIVGKGSGGFISKCQEKLGWDADPESLKVCVRGMCDNLFGKDPALHDLWEGCVWYVEWMHAVDNPTFTYKQVECPKELVDIYYSSLHPKP
jgi:hypothetical protein